MERLAQFFSDNFMMPHGYCFLWLPEITWLHVIADIMIALAYFSIPIMLYHFYKKRDDLPFKAIFLLFASFILLCGLTHVFSIIVLWFPYYGYEGLLKLATGIVSLATAFVVWKALPLALTLPSPAKLLEMNDELKDLNETVERKVEERTRELQRVNEDLARAYDIAEQANQAKSDFVAKVTHEIRTPMNAIVVLSKKFANNAISDDDYQECADTLAKSSSTLMALLNDILDFSKLEAGSIELETAPLQLDEIIKECQQLFEFKIGKDVSLKTSIKPDPFPVLKGDPLRLKQIVLNLLNNATKFTDKGKIKISVDAKQGSQNDEWDITLKVKDSGIGIPASQLDKVFDKFSQADSTIHKKFGGSGLGLAITRELVECMNGSISANSVEGEYTEFVINLTLSQSSEQELQQKREASKKRELTPADRRVNADCTILMVEDTEANILVGRLLFESLGYRLDVARTAREAVSKFQNKTYNIVLLDLHLPDADGYYVCEEMRKYETANKKIPTPIVALTAYATQDEQERCFECGMDDFLTKPIDDDELESMLREYCG